MSSSTHDTREGSSQKRIHGHPVRDNKSDFERCVLSDSRDRWLLGFKNEIDSTSRLQRVTNELIGSNQVENDLVCVSNVHKYYIHVTDIFRHHQDIASTFKVESGLGN